MIPERDPQGELFMGHNLFAEMVGKGSFYSELGRLGDRLFPDSMFEKLYCADNGRPCVPPSKMFRGLLLQLHDQCSDQEAVDRSRFDLRWKAALDIGLDDRLCGRSTLQEFRARLHVNPLFEALFVAGIDEARRIGLLKGTPLTAAIDTTPIFGRGALKDTYNLLADGIIRLVSALASLDGVPVETWAERNDLRRYWGSSLKGGAGIDWSDAQAKKAFLNGIVADADRLLIITRDRLRTLDPKEAEPLKQAAQLLMRIITQDTERDSATEKPKKRRGGRANGPSEATESTPGTTSGPAVAPQDPESTAPQEPTSAPQEEPAADQTQDSQGAPAADNPDLDTWGTASAHHLVGEMIRLREDVARNRLISVSDPDIRHGRKSASNLFYGYKSAVCVDTDSGLILNLAVTPGNAPDSQGALPLVQGASKNARTSVCRTIGDCAFGDGATRQAFKDADIELSAKVPSPPQNDPFHKSRFTLDLTNRIATCPAGQSTTDYDYTGKRAAGGAVLRFLFPRDTCQTCPHKSQCLRTADQNRGRTVYLHPQEELIQQARQRQASPAFREDIKLRQTVEHRQARLIQLGMRQARYFGLAKTWFQCLMTALVANIGLVAAFFGPFLATAILVGLHYPAGVRLSNSGRDTPPGPRPLMLGRLARSSTPKMGGLRFGL